MRGIYEIRIERPKGGALFYVGQSISIETRQRHHLAQLIAGRHENSHLQRAYKKYGFAAEGWFRVLELVPESEALTPREQFWIDARLAEVGRKRVMNMTLAAACPMHDPELRAKVKGSWQKRMQDPEKRAEMANRRARHYVLRSPEGERVEVYNLKAFCRNNGLNQGNLSAVMRGEKAHNKGWRRWEDN